MKQLIQKLLVAGFVATATVTSAYGQHIITVDEFGNGTDSLFGSLPAALQLEPQSGMVTLAYQLPFAGTAGDLWIVENGAGTNDMIRFDGAGKMFFFSLMEDADDTAPADVPLIILNYNNNIRVLFEVGPEGNNGAFNYSPFVGDPGFDNTPGAILVRYNFISDGVVPEPTTAALVGLGWLTFVMARRRSERQNTSLRLATHTQTQMQSQ